MNLMENINSNNIIENNGSNKTTIHDKALKKGSTSSLGRNVSFIRESVSDSGVPDRKLSATLDAAKRTSLRSQDVEMDLAEVTDSPKVPRKFISTWKHACDRTKDRTKELLKRWRTLPEGNTEMLPPNVNPPPSGADNPHNWSVHVWASYIKRYPSEDENLILDGEVTTNIPITLSSLQKEKLGHFFSHLLDIDHDDLISEQDFEHLSDRLRRFADWSDNSPEFVIMTQVQQGFINTFLANNSPSEGEKSSRFRYVNLEEWFLCWSQLIAEANNLQDFPLWLQYLPKLLFQAINKSDSGTITRDELGSFYSSVVGFTTQRVGEILDEAYSAFTSNGDHPINYKVYRLAFTNFLLGRHPNGPGQYIFGCVSKKGVAFPIDYSALNSLPEDLEHYTPDKKSNRISIVI